MSSRPTGARRPSSPRPAPGRRVSLAVALMLALAALAAGVLVGYMAHGDDASGSLLTETREVPVVTVTVPQ